MTSRHIEIPDDLLAAIDYCYEQGWTDGLPVVPPELSRVEAMCAMEGRPIETVLATHPATGLELTVQALGRKRSDGGVFAGIFSYPCCCV